MKMYEVKLHVREDRLTTIIDVVRGSAEIKGLSPIGEAAKIAAPRVAQRHTTATRGAPFGSRPHREDGKTTKSVLLDMMQDGKVHTREEAIKVLKEYGFSETSMSPASSELRRNGKIAILRDGSMHLLSHPTF